MKEVIWVAGTSGAGKNTFVRRASEDPELAARLGWAGKLVAAATESFENIQTYQGDPISRKRDLILTQVPALLERADVVLSKWQFVDSDAHRPQRLKEALPDARHGVIVLHAPDSELTERLSTRHWWERYGSDTYIAEEQELVAQAVRELAQHFPVVHLESGTGSDYRPFVPAE